ncbi:30S ribosomal protein S17e [Candidatus Woesearchaeota archaeon]|nr:30S ribosomal protein S17e [Candidatus Woesearchaeota archaeon]
MGRIKTQQVKRITEELYKKHADQFTPNYENNKVVLNQLTLIPSKKIRNTIAGYLARKAQQHR